MAEKQSSKQSAASASVNMAQIGLGFFELRALAEAADALLLSHERAESDEVIVSAHLVLKTIASRATTYADLAD